ncbi:mercuric reductase [Phytoactinopolyspora endophytica]|uniref:mercuric reductase n=1 Tax=Phytoactinopolyspora endophytica TaxID=1642495 RepID=UPI00101D36EA|nr:mercuric reductase [Phytoactinopolyspora endophytica]
MDNTRERFDAIVIGAGQAGPGVAGHLAGRGDRVALIEQDTVGGTCLNRGCRPTKALRASARVAQLARTARAHGVITGDVRMDFPAAVARKDEMIDNWVDGYTDFLEHTDGLSLIRGRARFTGTGADGHRVAVGDRELVATNVFLNVGTRAAVPPILGLDAVPWLDNDRILHLDKLPDHLVVLGGSYVALEFGQMFRRFGSTVTIIERGPRLASREDDDVAAEITRFLQEEEITIHTGTNVERVEPTAAGLRVHTDAAGAIEGSHLLVAVGRTPNTDLLNVESVGLELDDRGVIKVDGVFRTAVDGIWALGDINGRGSFTHTSYQDHEIVVDHLTGGTRNADTRILTYAMFTDPPLGRVGMSEREARASGRRVLMATFPMNQHNRARLDGETAGLIKLLVDADTDRFLGAATMGIAGDEIIQIVSALMHADAPCRVLAEMMPIHPTVAEFFPTILNRLKPLE